MPFSPGPELDALTKTIIGSAFTVGHTLGHGFLEAVYKNALALELEAQRLVVVKEKPFPVRYRDQQVGVYVADLFVENCVIVELKVAEALGSAHIAQVLNYLRASGAPVGLLFNYGKPRIELKRIVL